MPCGKLQPWRASPEARTVAAPGRHGTAAGDEQTPAWRVCCSPTAVSAQAVSACAVGGTGADADAADATASAATAHSAGDSHFCGTRWAWRCSCSRCRQSRCRRCRLCRRRSSRSRRWCKSRPGSCRPRCKRCRRCGRAIAVVMHAHPASAVASGSKWATQRQVRAQRARSVGGIGSDDAGARCRNRREGVRLDRALAVSESPAKESRTQSHMWGPVRKRGPSFAFYTDFKGRTKNGRTGWRGNQGRGLA